MKAVTTHLTEKQIEFLNEKSEETGIPKAKLIRDGIDKLRGEEK